MFDSNNDGKLTLHEVLSFFAKEHGTSVDKMPQNVKAEIKQQFEMYDADGNGYLTEEDMIAWYIKTYEHLARQNGSAPAHSKEPAPSNSTQRTEPPKNATRPAQAPSTTANTSNHTSAAPSN